MKRMLLLLSFALTVNTLYAEGERTVYCSTTTDGYVRIDYGQRDQKKNLLVDENGRSIYFRSMVAVMNYMAERGWNYESEITTVESDIFEPNEIESHTLLIFSKRIDSMEEITEGLLTQQMFLEQQ